MTVPQVLFSLFGVLQIGPLTLQGPVHTRPSARMQPFSLSFAQPARLWRTYEHHLERSPVATKTATSVVASIAGDALAQHFSRSKGQRYDWARTARFAAFNGLLLGPVGHMYYTYLDSSVMPTSARSPAAVASKVVIDQLVFAPICTVIFYAWKCFTEGRPGELRQELGEKYMPTMVANWKLWPAAHVINFAFVPPRQRILYANIVSVLGVYILSRAAAGDFGKRKGLVPQQQEAQALRRPVIARMASRHLQQTEEGAAGRPGGEGAMTMVVKME